MTSIDVENLKLAEEKTADDRGRVSLGKEYANARLFVIVDDRNNMVNSNNNE